MTINSDWLSAREQRLPKWARERISDLVCADINREMNDCVQADIRRLAKRVTGGNCTFSDDDAHLLAGLAELAIDAGLHVGHIVDRETLAGIDRAKAFRAAERDALAAATREGGDAKQAPCEASQSGGSASERNAQPSSSLTIAGLMVFRNPTHWMPLPQPPESGQ